jgi:hypothetical protein
VARRRPEGRLVTIEGTLGADVLAAAARLSTHGGRHASQPVVSVWNASRIFKRMHPDRYHGPVPGVRTLVLLYAADLAHRCKREIRPALRAGRTVVAAPYVHTVMAFGIASGLSEQWLGHIFRFAPVPHVCYRIKERRKGSAWSTRTGEGFLELCDGLLAGGVAAWQPLAARQAAIEYLRELEEKGLCEKLGGKKIRNDK